MKGKLRVLHAASLARPSSGQLQQMNWEQEAADLSGVPWTVRMYGLSGAVPDSPVAVLDDQVGRPGSSRLPWVRAWRWLALRRNYHRWLASRVDEHDIFMLRYYVHDPFQYLFVRRCPKPVVFFSHTLEVPELRSEGGIVGRIRAALESTIGRRTLNLADGLVGVTEEVLDYQLGRAEIPPENTAVYPNGVIWNDTPLVDTRDKEVPELLFVANFVPWHGLDELLDSMEQSAESFVLHVVGTVPAATAARARADSRVRLHGLLAQPEIQEIASSCWTGISSLALSRKGARQAATLKAPQYLMMGLPVYGCGDVLPIDFAHYQKGEADIENILAFSRASRPIGKGTVREAARPLIDKRLLLESLYSTVTAWNFERR